MDKIAGDTYSPHPRSRGITYLVWVAWAAAVLAGVKLAGVVGLLVVAGAIGIGASRNWGERITDKALVIMLPAVIVLAVVVAGAAGNITKQATQQPQVAPPAQNDDWNQAVAEFQALHPDLGDARNAAIMQHALDVTVKPGMSAREVLQAGYDSAIHEPGWVPAAALKE